MHSFLQPTEMSAICENNRKHVRYIWPCMLLAWRKIGAIHSRATPKESIDRLWSRFRKRMTASAQCDGPLLADLDQRLMRLINDRLPA